MSQDAPFSTLREIEEAHIRAALERTGGNLSQAAKLLGIDRRTLYRRAEAAGIKRAGAATELRRAWCNPKAVRARLAELEGNGNG